MGSIMDYDGRVFQVAATFTPLQRVDAGGGAAPVSGSMPGSVQVPVKMETLPNAHISKFLCSVCLQSFVCVGLECSLLYQEEAKSSTTKK